MRRGTAPRGATWRAGYRQGRAVHVTYGNRLGRDVARALGYAKQPDDGWVDVLAAHTGQYNAKDHHVIFVLRPEVRAALRQLRKGPTPKSAASLDDGEDDECRAVENRLTHGTVTRRSGDARLKAAAVRIARRRSPDGKLRCAVHGCGSAPRQRAEYRRRA